MESEKQDVAQTQRKELKIGSESEKVWQGLINLLSYVCMRMCVCAWRLTKGTALIWIRR